jgi:hypothetical protein
MIYKLSDKTGKLCWCPKMALLEKQLLLSSIITIKEQFKAI